VTRSRSAIVAVSVFAEPLRAEGVLPDKEPTDVDLVPPVDLFDRADRSLQLQGALVAVTLRGRIPVTLLPADPAIVSARLAEAEQGDPGTVATFRHRTPVGIRYHVFVRFADADSARTAMGGEAVLDEARLAPGQNR
jgi:hypothetical protein